MTTRNMERALRGAANGAGAPPVLAPAPEAEAAGAPPGAPEPRVPGGQLPAPEGNAEENEVQDNNEDYFDSEDGDGQENQEPEEHRRRVPATPPAPVRAPTENLAHQFAGMKVDPPAPLVMDTLRALELPKPPMFDGRGEYHLMEQFLYAVEAYLGVGQITRADTQVYIAGGYLLGDALSWFQAAQQSSDPKMRITDMQEFKAGLRKAFGAPDMEMNARNKLANTVQSGTVREYSTAFRNVVLLLPDITPAERFHAYITGLRPAVRKEILIRRIKDYTEAAAVAEAIDVAAQMSDDRTAYQGPGRGAQPPRPPNQPSGQQNRAALRLHALARAPARRGKLTPEEREDLMSRGACFYCREEGHIAATCPNKRAPARADAEGDHRAPEGNGDGQ